MFYLPYLNPGVLYVAEKRHREQKEKLQKIQLSTFKSKFSEDFHTKIFTPDMNGKFEIYLAHVEIAEDKKKQLLKELSAFADRVEEIINE